MRKYLILAMLAVFVAALSPVAALAGQEKLTVCHLEGNDTFHLIEVAEPAYYNALIAHGDLLPGDAVPDMPGYVFDDTCQPTEALSVSVSVEWENTVGTVTADETGFAFEFAGEIYSVPDLVYHPDYWGTYALYLPENEAWPVVHLDIAGVPEETLTVAFDVFQLSQDGTLGASTTPYPGASFQHSFVVVEGTTTYVMPAGVWPDVSEPYGFLVLDPGEAQFLHLAVAQIYLGTDTSGEPLVTVESIIDLG